jgi:transcription initiation factor TFIID subunit 10
MSGESSIQPPAIAPKEQPAASSSNASDATKVNGQTPAQNGSNNATTDENKEAQDQSDIELTKLFTAKREEDMARRDRTLAEFLVMLDGYKPLVCFSSWRGSANSQIPEEVTEYYLQRSGFDCSDPRL